LSFLVHGIDNSVARGGLLLVISSRRCSCIGHGDDVVRGSKCVRFCKLRQEMNGLIRDVMLRSGKVDFVKLLCFVFITSLLHFTFSIPAKKHGSSREEALIDVVITARGALRVGLP
jgi:hypothetical protein